MLVIEIAIALVIVVAVDGVVGVCSLAAQLA